MLLAAAITPGPRGGMGFIDDQEVGTVVDEGPTPAVGFDEVDARDEMRVVAEDADMPRWQAPFQPGHGGGLHDGRLDVELRHQLFGPLIAKVRGTKHGDPADGPAIEQLPRDHAGFDGLADAYIVGDQQPHRVESQRHEQQHVLIRPRLHR